MKNTEWGATAYLSHSKYGINKEININNNNLNMTGYSAVIGTDQSSYPGTYGSDSTITLPYNTETGYLASTTGNISGIYDMSGGTEEYVAAYKENSSDKSGFENDPILVYGKKYFDKYDITSEINTYNNRILGDATGELGPFHNYADNDQALRSHNSWYSDQGHFVSTTSNWIARGGHSNIGVLASQFHFGRNTGGASTFVSFRIVIL